MSSDHYKTTRPSQNSKSDPHSMAAGMGVLLLLISLGFAVAWMLEYDRAGVLAAAAFGGGVLVSIVSVITATIDRKRN